MTEVTANAPDGTPNWIDLGIPDIGRAKEFYGALFGWDWQDLEMPEGPYTLCLLRGRPVAGIAGADPESTSYWWNQYFAADDADGTAKLIADAGGRIVVEPGDIADQGRLAIAVDPVGAQFGLWQGAAHPGSQIVNEPGSPAWSELVTPDPEPARAFYTAVFGHTLEPIPGGFDYTVLNRPDGHPIGGIYGLPEAPSSSWLVYFETDDPDAAARRAAEAGGQAGEPVDSPYGRMADVIDPFGAGFRVIRSAQPPA